MQERIIVIKRKISTNCKSREVQTEAVKLQKLDFQRLGSGSLTFPSY
jgi:hypothetical protein